MTYPRTLPGAVEIPVSAKCHGRPSRVTKFGHQPIQESSTRAIIGPVLCDRCLHSIEWDATINVWVTVFLIVEDPW